MLTAIQFLQPCIQVILSYDIPFIIFKFVSLYFKTNIVAISFTDDCLLALPYGVHHCLSSTQSPIPTCLFYANFFFFFSKMQCISWPSFLLISLILVTIFSKFLSLISNFVASCPVLWYCHISKFVFQTKRPVLVGFFSTIFLAVPDKEYVMSK